MSGVLTRIRNMNSFRKLTPVVRLRRLLLICALALGCFTIYCQFNSSLLFQTRHDLSPTKDDVKLLGMLGSNDVPKINKPNVNKDHNNRSNNENRVFIANTVKQTETKRSTGTEKSEKHVSNKNKQKSTNNDNNTTIITNNNKDSIDQNVGRNNSIRNVIEKDNNTSKYIMYVCENFDCYGLGDRQRAMTSLYYLAKVTGRKLLINMTSPAPFTEFYIPNEYNWVAKEKELHGKSSIVLRILGWNKKNIQIKWDTIDFNKQYPQDIVGFKTNQNFYAPLQKNPLYKNKLPLTARWQIHAEAWLKLMKPTDELRSDLNQQLLEIARTQRQEQEAYTKFDSSVCQNRCNSSMNGLLNNKTKNQECLMDAKNRSYTIFMKDGIDLCRYPTPESKVKVRDEEIRQLKGHDTVDLGLVCAHVRIGKSATLTKDSYTRNNVNDVQSIWKVLEPLVSKGHHVYLATDSQEVRDLGLSTFGHRMHLGKGQITHTNVKTETDLAREGFKLALMEQLLLSTSCQVLIVSKSGFSFRAAMIRRFLMGEKDIYLFHDGAVKKWHSWYLY